jgi:flagellar hook assembly protein FlgD
VAASGPATAGGSLGIVSLTPRALAPRASSEGVAIGIRLPRSGAVKVRVHNLAGRLLSVVADEALPAGTHVVRWDGRGPSGSPVDHGIYLVTVEAHGQRASKTLAVLP